MRCIADNRVYFAIVIAIDYGGDDLIANFTQTKIPTLLRRVRKLPRVSESIPF